jgi:hypothetical protein
VITHDLDFDTILALTHRKRPSIVQVRSLDVSPDAVLVQTIAALRHVEVELPVGALLTIEPDRARLRILPLRLDEQRKRRFATAAFVAKSDRPETPDLKRLVSALTVLAFAAQSQKAVILDFHQRVKLRNLI